MGGMVAGGSNGDHTGGSELPLKYPYGRPEFLGLSPDEVECSADHSSRPIVIVKETKRLPWSTGYAELSNTHASIFSCTLRPSGGGFPGAAHQLVNNSISCYCCYGWIRVTDGFFFLCYTEAQSPC